MNAAAPSTWAQDVLDAAREEDSRELPLVSIVIPAFNAESYLSDALDSLLRQTYSALEILVIDDGSTDATRRIMEGYALQHKEVRAFHNSERLYSAASRNVGIRASKGRYVMMHDADDLCEPNRVERLVTFLESHHFDFVASGHYLFDESGPYQTHAPKTAVPTRWDFLTGSPYCHASCMFARSCLVAADGYLVHPRTIRGQDYELLMRLHSLGFRGANLPDVLYGYRVDHATIARRTWRHRLDECWIRWHGFRRLGLLPWALLFVLRPVPAHMIQVVRHRRTRG